MSIFGRWLRATGHDALSSIDMEATRAALQRLQRLATFGRDLAEAAATARASLCPGCGEESLVGGAKLCPSCQDLCTYREAALQERKEQSIIAALVFGCSCAHGRPPEESDGRDGVAFWLLYHTHCAGLDSMLREGA